VDLNRKQGFEDASDWSCDGLTGLKYSLVCSASYARVDKLLLRARVVSIHAHINLEHFHDVGAVPKRVARVEVQDLMMSFSAQPRL